MLLQGKILRNLLIGIVVFNVLLIGLFFYASAKQPWLPGAIFPGKFGPGIAPEFTGNMVELATLLLINAIVITLVGFKDCLHAMWAGLRLSPKVMRKFLNEKAGLAADISGVVAAAVQEEEKLELTYIDRAGWVLRIGLILFALALPSFAIALARAEAATPMFAIEQVSVPNVNISNEEIWRFTGDQIAGALLLDIPEVFHLKLSKLEANTGNFPFAFLALLYRTLIGFGVLLAFVAAARMRTLWRYAMEVAMPVRDIVAMEPALAAGSEHNEYRHSNHEPRWQETHRDPEPDDKHVRHEVHAEPVHAHSAYEEQEHHREEVLAENAHAHDHTGQHHGHHTGERHRHDDDETAS